LEDGTFVSSSEDRSVKRWDENGTVLRTFAGHTHRIKSVIELINDILVAMSWDSIVVVWRVSEL